MLEAHLCDKSKTAYSKAWSHYLNFATDYLESQTNLYDITPGTFLLFIAYLKCLGLAPASVTSAVSAVSYKFQINGFPSPSENFLVRKALSGLRKLEPSNDIRLPITLPLLEKLVNSVDCVFSNFFLRQLFKSMYTLAFYAFLRVGEFTSCSAAKHPVLAIHDVLVDQLKPEHGLSILFRNYKHNTGGRPFSLNVSPQSKTSICPVRNFLNYLQVRPKRSNSPVFIMPDGTPVLTSFFNKHLQISLSVLKLNSNQYKSHSFRIGAATWAASNGLSDSQIQRMGRWKSDAFKKYLRHDSIST